MIDGYHAKQFVPPNASVESDRIGEEQEDKLKVPQTQKKRPKRKASLEINFFVVVVLKLGDIGSVR
jgi:hypothetical protein